MKWYRATYLSDRFFYAIGWIVCCFCLAFAFEWMTVVAWCSIAALIGLIAVDVWLLFRHAAPIAVDRSTASLFSLFDDNPVVLNLINNTRQPFKLRIIDELPAQFQQRDFCITSQISPEDSLTLNYQLKPLKRGAYHFGDIHLFLRSKIGLMERRHTTKAAQMVKVYPSIIQMEMFELMVFSADRQQAGIKRIRKLGHGYEFSDIRKYVVGDDPRSINWKASSRSNALMVNNYEDERSQQIYAVINKSRVMRMPFDGLSLMDYAINATLSLQNIVLRNQDNAGLMVFSGQCETFLRAERKFNQRQMLLDKLYNIREDQQEANYQALYETIKMNIQGRSMLMLFTNFMSLNSLQRVLPVLKRINRSHLLTIIFFENPPLEAFIEKEPNNLLDMASNVLASRLSNELTQVVYELRNTGIQAIQTKPEDLTANAINKYLELKSRGMI